MSSPLVLTYPRPKHTGVWFRVKNLQKDNASCMGAFEQMHKFIMKMSMEGGDAYEI